MMKYRTKRKVRALVENPFVSEAQRRACYAKDDPAWDCAEWQAKTKGKLPKRKAVRNKGRRSGGRKKVPNPLRIDPTRTATLRRRYIAELNKRWAELRRRVFKLVVTDDAFGLSPATQNQFCPTGPGGGIDPTCGKSDGVLKKIGSAAEKTLIGGGYLGHTFEQVLEGMEAFLHPIGAIKFALHSMHVGEHLASAWIKDKVGGTVEKLPEPYKSVAHAGWFVGKVGVKALFLNWILGQSMVERVAKEKGMSDDKARQLRGVLSKIDLNTFEVFKVGALAGIHAFHLPVAITAALPIASSGYLAYSTAVDPVSTIKAAGGAVSDAWKWTKSWIPEQQLRNTQQDDVHTKTLQIYYALQAHNFDDWYIALLYAALDKVGHIDPALQLADAAYERRLTNNGWVTLAHGQHVFIGVDGALHPNGPPEGYWGNKQGQSYWRPGPNPTVDAVVTRGKGAKKEILLIRRADKEGVTERGKWALPGGFHDTNAKKGEPWREDKESARDAALRELHEETGLDAADMRSHLRQVGSYEGHNRDPRDNAEAWSKSTAFHLHLGGELATKPVKGQDDADRAKWVPIKELKKYDLAFDHAKIIKDAALTHNVVTNAQPWPFMSDAEKLEAFKQWLDEQYEDTLLGADEEEVWQKFMDDGFKQGAGRAFDDTKPKPPGSQEKLDFYAGTREQFLKSAFGRPAAIEKVKLLASRNFTELEGVTDAMSQLMSRSLADGLARGASPHEVAGDLYDDLDIGYDRAETIARTETIRAHAEGQLTALEELGVKQVGVMVEWSTTGDEKVCELCEPLEGVVLDIDKASGLIPRHPNCRCAWIPAGVGEEDDDQITDPAEIDAAFAASGLDSPLANMLQDFLVGNFNPYHDQHGRFTSAGGTGLESINIHRDAHGNWHESRKELHNRLVNERFQNKTPVEHPTAYLMGGGPAAGKSTIIPHVKIPANTVIVNSDDIKVQLPEYKAAMANGDSKAAHYVHKESGHIADQIQDRASKGGYNSLADGTGDSDLKNLSDYVNKMRDSGQRVVAHYVTVDTDTAVARALERAKESGRYVPESVIRTVHAGVSKVVPEAIKAGLYDEFTLWDTNHQGPPRKVASAKGTNLTVHDADAWQKFLQKGMVTNVFCATGPGGGVDATCTKGGSEKGVRWWEKLIGKDEPKPEGSQGNPVNLPMGQKLTDEQYGWIDKLRADPTNNDHEILRLWQAESHDMRASIASGKPSVNATQLLEIMDKAPKYEGTAYRCLKDNSKTAFDVINTAEFQGNGSTFKFNAPFSTSRSLGMAKDFGQHLLMIMKHKDGTPIEGSSGRYLEEKEIIGKNASTWKIVDHKKDVWAKSSDVGIPVKFAHVVTLEEQ